MIDKSDEYRNITLELFSQLIVLSALVGNGVHIGRQLLYAVRCLKNTPSAVINRIGDFFGALAHGAGNLLHCAGLGTEGIEGCLN